MTAQDLLRPFTTHSAQQRGAEYLDRVITLEGDRRRVVAEIQGRDLYEVEIHVDGDSLRVWCDCPYFSDDGSGCKHLWAAAAIANQNGWLTDLPASLRVVIDLGDLEDHELRIPGRGNFETRYSQPAPPRQPPPPPAWTLALHAVQPSQPVLRAPVWADSQLLYVLTAPVRGTVTELPLTVEKHDRKRDGEWSKPQPLRLTRSAIPQLPDPDDRWALSLVYATSSYPRDAASYGYGFESQPVGVVYLQAALLDLLLPRLCATGRVRLRHAHAYVPAVATLRRAQGGPAFDRGAKSDGEMPLAWDPGEPWRFRLVITRDGETAVAGGNGGRSAYRIDAVLCRGNERESIHRFALLTDSIAVLDNAAAPFDPAGGFTWAAQLRARGPILVPAESRRALIDSIAASAVEDVTLPDDLQWEERVVTPRFCATIGKPNPYFGTCAIDVSVEYDDLRAPIDGSARLVTPDGRVLYRRDPAAEQEALAMLKRHGVSGLDPHIPQGPSINPKKLAALVHALVAEGWLVDADGVRYRAIAAPRLHIRSGIDWFELEALDDGGGAVDLPDLVKALKAGRRTVALGDGSIGMLPEEWLARVAPLLALGETSAAGVRFKPSQVALIDALLAAQPAVDWDEGFARARDALHRFEGVHAEDAPSTFHGTLRAYQRESLGWMRFLRDFGFGGCLADDMGLGKTVMVVAMLEARRLDSTRPHRPSLVVLPRTLLFNWMSEASRFAPGLRLLDFAHADRHAAVDAIADHDLVLTTYGTLRRDVPALKDHHFDYVVLDEAQAIKNAVTATAKAVRLLRADHRLALTGTPVENHIGELQSLFDFLNPGLLGRGKVLDLRRQAGGGGASEHVARLAKGLRPFFLRRTKEQVAPELPPRTEETLYCELDGEQRRTYQELRDHYRRVLLKKIDRDGLAKSKFQILEALLRLRQAACHLGLLPGANGVQASAKFDLLLPRLAELMAEGRKALVFSQFTSLLALLRQRLDAGGVVYEYLDGETRDRAERVTRFQEDASCPLFLISLKAGGVGLNLTAAEYVFLLDPWWNPAVEMQAIDRTHRIGQTKPVFAYRLVARETVEERILELQSRKRALADAILDAGTGGLRGLQREDLEQLLS